jgi:DNA-binding CsgD family transcriptional regulator
LLGAAPGPRLRRRIQSANGVAAAIVDLVKSAVSDGLLMPQADGALDLQTDDLPISLTSRTARRLQRLGPAAEQLAAAMAVCGAVVDPGLATAIARTDETFARDSLRRVVDSGLVEVQNDHFVWPHELVRETVLSTLSEGVRIDLELRAGRLQLERNVGDEIALSHLERGAAPFGELVPVHTRLASSGSSLQRVHSLRWLLDFDTQFSAGSAQRTEWLQALCQSSVELGDNVDLHWASNQLAAESPSDSMAWLYLVSSHIGSNRMVEAAEAAQRGIGLVADAPTRAKLLAALVLSNLTTLDTGVSNDLDKAAVEVVDGTDFAAIAAVHTVRSRLHAHEFDHVRAQLDTEVALAASVHPDLEVLHYLPHHFAALARFESDDVDGALVAVSEGRQYSEGLGALWPDGVLLSAAASILWAAGREVEAIAAANDAVRAARSSTITPVMLPALAVLAEVALDAADLGLASDLLDEADAVVGEGGKFGLEYVASARARLLDALDQGEAALGVAEMFWSIFDDIGIGPAAVHLAVPLVVRAHKYGRLDLVARVAQRMAKIPACASALVRSVGEWIAGVDANDEGAARAAALSFPEVRARGRRELFEAHEKVFGVSLGFSYLGSSNVGSGLASAVAGPTGSSSPKVLHPGAGSFPSMMDAGMQEELPSSLDAASVVANAGLTPMQRLVASALAQGLSNKEIAVQHFMKVRTVEAHVQRILRKLGVHSRTKAASLLRSSEAIATQ